MTGAAIDTTALLKMLYSSVLAGVGVTVVFSVTVLGAIRASDMRRARRAGAAVAYGALAAIGLLVSTGIVAFGLILLTRKG
jgi:hypothetical protein